MKKALVAVILIAINISCKQKQILPDATEEGLNTFGVKINGKVWLPIQEVNLFGSEPMLRASLYDGVLGIVARKKSSDEVIALVVKNVKSAGSYSVMILDSDGINATTYKGNLLDDEYSPFVGGINDISINKLDTVNHIVSGTFNIQMKGKNIQSIKNFTQGIFDVKYEK